MYVVLSLPPQCDRNRFRITIIRKDERATIVYQDLVWSSKYGAFGYLFSPKKIVEIAGPGAFTAKFYSGPEPIMMHDFRIEGAGGPKKFRNALEPETGAPSPDPAAPGQPPPPAAVE